MKASAIRPRGRIAGPRDSKARLCGPADVLHVVEEAEADYLRVKAEFPDLCSGEKPPKGKPVGRRSGRVNLGGKCVGGVLV